MESRRLAEIQTAIQRLTDARQTELAEEIAAAQVLLNASLSPNLTPQQVLAEGKVNLGRFEKLIEGQERIANLAKTAKDSINITATNLEAADRLGIAPGKIDAEIDFVLGVAGQTGRFFLDPKTGTLILGREAGQLTPAMVDLVGVLKPGEVVGPTEIAARLEIEEPSASHLLRRTRRVSGDSLIGSMGRGRYKRNSKLVVLGEAAATPTVTPPEIAPTPEKPVAERFWGAQIVTGLEHIGRGTLKTMEQAGVLKQGEHFEITPSGKRVYLPPAKNVAEKLNAAVAAAPMGRITQSFVLKTFDQTEKRKPKPAQPEFPDYGPNGPGVLTPLHELAALNLLQQGAPQIGDRLGGGISPEFSEDLDKWIQAKRAELMASTPDGAVSEDDKLRIRRETAAAVLEMYQDLRPFNYVRQQLGGLEFVVAFIKAAKQRGQEGERVVADFAAALVNPPTSMKDPDSPWDGGVVGNNIKRIGSLA